MVIVSYLALTGLARLSGARAMETGLCPPEADEERVKTMGMSYDSM